MQFPRHLRRGLLALIVTAALFPPQAAAAPILIFPTDDDRGLDAFLNGNFACCQLDMGQGTVTLTTFEERLALEFALGGLPPNPVINSATLTLFIPVAPLVLNDAQVHGYAGDGVIMVPDLTVANLLTDFQVGAAGSVVIPLDPSFIQDLVTANEAFAGFMLRNVTAASGVFTIWTVDSGFDQFNPVLELDVEESQVIPEPGTLVLLGTALAACGGRRAWRRRQRTP